MNKKYNAIQEGDKIFTEVAQMVEWTQTDSISEAYQLLEKLRQETEGLVIVDFLDGGNWDSIASIEMDGDFLQINWRDYRDLQETDEFLSLRKLMFPADLVSLLIKFRELRIVRTQNYPIFFLRGFAIKDKDIKNNLKGVEIKDNKNNFSKFAVREIDSHFETFHCLSTPIFSIIILPKNCGIQAVDSIKILLLYNLNEAIIRLNKVKNSLMEKELADEDGICEKANSIRRIFESVLKVELCHKYMDLNVKKDYSDLLLGDLVSLVKPLKDEISNLLLKEIVIYANELSHDSGKPIHHKDCVKLSDSAITYTTALKSEILK